MSEQSGPAPEGTHPARGLLSLLYWVKHDPVYNRKFHENELVTLREFGITDPLIVAEIRAIGALSHDIEAAAPRLLKFFEDHLVRQILSGDSDNVPFW